MEHKALQIIPLTSVQNLLLHNYCTPGQSLDISTKPVTP